MSYEPIFVMVKAKTAKAILVDDGLQDTWIPLSLIDESDSVEPNEAQEINVERWFLEKEGLL